MIGDPLLQRGQLGLVAADQVEHVLPGADRTLDAAQRVAVEQPVDPLVRDQQLLGHRGEPLAQGGHLRGDVVRPRGDRLVGVAGGQLAEPGQHGDHPGPDQAEGGDDLQLLDVLGQVTGGHALVHVLVAGEGVELLDPGLDVVPGDPLPGGDAGQVDRVDHCLVRGEDRRRVVAAQVHAEIVLGGEHGEPEPPLGDDLALRAPRCPASPARRSGWPARCRSCARCRGLVDARLLPVRRGEFDGGRRPLLIHPGSDVGAEERAGQGDPADPGVRPCAGQVEIGPVADHAEHPAAAADQPPLGDRGRSRRGPPPPRSRRRTPGRRSPRRSPACPGSSPRPAPLPRPRRRSTPARAGRPGCRSRRRTAARRAG